MKILIFLILLCSFVFSQTSSFTVSWDLNTEPDILAYQVFRSLSPNATTQVVSIIHPTNQYVDSNIQRGIQYYYRLKASDNSLNQSVFSTEVSAAIPNILLTTFTFENQQIDTVANTVLFVDPDDSEIVLTTSNETNINVTIDNGFITLEPNPSNFSGEASFTLNVADPSGFFDEQTIDVIFNSSIPPSQPQNVKITRD